MPEPLGEHNIHQSLTALADGELDAAQMLQAIEYLATHPEALQWVRDQQAMNNAARRVLGSKDDRAPDSLRQRILAMDSMDAAAVTPSPDVAPVQPPPQKRQPAWTASNLWWQALAAAVLLAVGLMVGRRAWQPGVAFNPPVSLPPYNQAPAQIIPASIVAHASRVHDDCSRLAAGLHSAGYPQNQGDLAAAVERDLHSDRPYPDLAAIGFRYEGAGPCGSPLANTIHLLYRTLRPGSHATLSLFVQRFTGQFPLPAGKVFTVSVAQSPFPMLVWRTDQVVYFLIADDQKTENAALDLIRSAPAPLPSATVPSKPNLPSRISP